MKMNQKEYTHTSFSKQPTKLHLEEAKKRLGNPKMFNVELTSNQAQCKPKMAGSKISVNVLQQFQQFQKRIKQMKRTILKKIEKFEHRYLKDYDEMNQTGSIQIILKEQKNITDRSRKMENEVENFNFFLIDEWDESEEEIEKMIEKNITEMMKYSDKIDVVINRSYDIIDHMESSTQPAHDTKFTNDKLVNPGADKFNLIKLNNGTNGTNVNTISYNVDDDSAEEQAKIAQLREANKEMKVLQDKVHMYEEATSCIDGVWKNETI